MSLNFNNRNSLWCSVIAETLSRCGVSQAVLSPGSRSTPLTFAFAAHPGFECTPVLDERSAGFFALGLARQSGKPVVLVCTSGSAAANYLPAVVEAHESGIPLLVFTADRPPEMRSCSSGQTIDQQKIFGSYAVFYHEYATPEPDQRLLAYARQMTQQAVERSLGATPGPVHLNCPFRDPLHPVESENLNSLRLALEDKLFWAHLHVHEPLPAPSLAEAPRFPRRGLIIAGPDADFSEARVVAIAELSKRLGWPVLADALSPLRQYAIPGFHPLTRYDIILRSQEAAKRLEPEGVLILDALPTSKVLRNWLGSQRGITHYHLSTAAESRDPLHVGAHRLPTNLSGLLRVLPAFVSCDAFYSLLWAEAEKAVEANIAAQLNPQTHLNEPRAAWLLPKLLHPAYSVFLSNSMPVRDAEYLWPGTAHGRRVFFNRGANGIDGILSTALGVAQGGQPTLLVTGELSFLHDSNGLLLRQHFKGSLTVLLVNNGGGGIFEHLPVSEYGDTFERYFATPQDVDFELLAKAHRLSYELILSWAAYEKALAQPPEPGIRILELRTDRKADASLRKSLFAGVAKSLALVKG